MLNLKILAAKSHIITLTNSGVRYKLFRLDFQKDGSLLVNFPYYKSSIGIASKVHMRINNQRTYESLSLTEDARITSHRIKYSHHTTGEALFSMDGKIHTEIRKKSVPLSESMGHVFTVQIQGFKGFDEALGEKYDHGWKQERSTIHFDVPKDLGAIRFVATWEHYNHFIKDIKVPMKNQGIGPQVAYNDPKDPGLGFMLSPDLNNPFNDYILLLRAHQMPILDKDRDSLLSFIGGFDPINQVNDLSRESVFLSLMYPVADVEAMKKILLSMDYVKSS